MELSFLRLPCRKCCTGSDTTRILPKLCWGVPEQNPPAGSLEARIRWVGALHTTSLLVALKSTHPVALSCGWEMDDVSRSGGRARTLLAGIVSGALEGEEGGLRKRECSSTMSILLHLYYKDSLCFARAFHRRRLNCVCVASDPPLCCVYVVMLFFFSLFINDFVHIFFPDSVVAARHLELPRTRHAVPAQELTRLVKVSRCCGAIQLRVLGVVLCLEDVGLVVCVA